ncbi:MAG TPA: hypothetical protein VF633_02560 [Brevundimonas sp.]
MDLTRYDTREKAHEGVDVPLIIDGETIIGDDDEPVTFRLRGIADPDVHRVILGLRRGDSRTPAEVLENDMRLARVAVAGWSGNWSLAGRKVPYSREGIAEVFAVPTIRRAVLAEVLEDSHFMNGS